jgi:uncharacterized SAM-binding protein YcdF (DUF218 family)
MKNSKNTEAEKTGAIRHRVFGIGSGLAKLTLGLGLLASFVFIGFFIGGFLKFIDTIARYEQRDIVVEKTDAIVVFTGGSSRIEEAIKLLRPKSGRRLLISGVNPITSRQALLDRTGADAAVFECCVDIETRATDTIGNARETGKWVEKHKFASLTIVTSSYHMPRSLLETNRQLPDVNLVAYPVQTTGFDSKNWYKDRETLLLLFSEYSKFVGAQIRPVFGSNTLRSMKADLLGN